MTLSSDDSADEPSARLDLLAEHLVSRGLAEQGDFYVWGRFPNAVPSSEHIGIRFQEGRYRVWHRDMGRQVPLVETEDFEEARQVFIREAVKLARSRGRRVTGFISVAVIGGTVNAAANNVGVRLTRDQELVLTRAHPVFVQAVREAIAEPIEL